MEVARRAQASAHGRRLFVSGVASEVKKTDLQREFGEFGHVTDIELPLTAKGVAFVEFDNARDAADALEEVTGKKLKGMVLKVKMADMQKPTTGPAMAASADDRFAGMTRVENDSRHLRAPGTNAGVVPTVNQGQEDWRMHPRSRDNHEKNGDRRSSSPSGRWGRSRCSRSGSTGHNNKHNDRHLARRRCRSASGRHDDCAREGRMRSSSRSPRRARSPRTLTSPSVSRSETSDRHREKQRSKSKGKCCSRSRSMRGSESCSTGKKQRGKIGPRKRRPSRCPSNIQSCSASAGGARDRGKRRRHMSHNGSRHEYRKRSASS
mmetsp:Transcript_38821/g.76971  ORF Transcript_38821/g.76971 Transcript_38821/m.76971 type:complete len:321 (+) Transcript_38821:59-1021(+)